MEIIMVWLTLKCPTRIVGVDHGDLVATLRSHQMVTDVYQFIPDRLQFFIAASRLPMMVQYTMPVLLGAKPRGAPAEVDDRICSMCDCLVGP